MGTASITKTNQYLTFRLGHEVYALDVGNAREIVERTLITRIPKTPVWIRGVINLRGTVVPVLDLKLKFGMGATTETVDTCVILVESILDGEVFFVGLLADGVQEVFELEASKIEPPPRFGSKVAMQYVRGMGRRGDQLFIVLDAERLFCGAEIAEAQDVIQSKQDNSDSDATSGEEAQ